MRRKKRREGGTRVLERKQRTGEGRYRVDNSVGTQRWYERTGGRHSLIDAAASSPFKRKSFCVSLVWHRERVEEKRSHASATSHSPTCNPLTSRSQWRSQGFNSRSLTRVSLSTFNWRDRWSSIELISCCASMRRSLSSSFQKIEWI